MRRKSARKIRSSSAGESIRSLSRGIAVLRAMNQAGSGSILELSRATGISRPALYRILATLEREGYVASVRDGASFALTSKIRELSFGYRDQDAFTEAAIPILDRLQREVMWPTDLAIYEDGQMVLRETTRPNSPLVFDRAAVGWRLPVLHTSLGIAYLSGLDEVALNGVLRKLKRSKDPLDSIAHEPGVVAQYLEQARSQGYASRPRGIFPTTDSIAVCVENRLSPIGAIGITFVASAMTAKEAAKKFLAALTAAARELTLKADAIEP